MGFCITYVSMDRHYIVHTKDGGVQLNKDEMVLLYIGAKKLQNVAFV